MLDRGSTFSSRCTDRVCGEAARLEGPVREGRTKPETVVSQRCLEEGSWIVNANMHRQQLALEDAALKLTGKSMTALKRALDEMLRSIWCFQEGALFKNAQDWLTTK